MISSFRILLFLISRSQHIKRTQETFEWIVCRFVVRNMEFFSRLLLQNNSCYLFCWNFQVFDFMREKKEEKFKYSKENLLFSVFKFWFFFCQGVVFPLLPVLVLFHVYVVEYIVINYSEYILNVHRQRPPLNTFTLKSKLCKLNGELLFMQFKCMLVFYSSWTFMPAGWLSSSRSSLCACVRVVTSARSLARLYLCLYEIHTARRTSSHCDLMICKANAAGGTS